MMRQSASAQRLDLLEGGAEDDIGGEHNTLLRSDDRDNNLQPSFRGGNFYASGSGQLTHYTISGPSNGRLAVCVHGMTLASYTFTDISQTLAHAGFRVLRYDMFGRGLSSAPPPGAPCNTKTYVAQLELLLQGLGLWAEASHNGVLIGASLGGAVAASFCAAHRELFSQLILMAPIGLPNFKLPILARVLDTRLVGRPLSCVLRTCCSRVLRSYVVDMFQDTRWHDALAEDVRHTPNNFVSVYMSTLKRFEWTTLKTSVYQKLGENKARDVTCIWGEEDEIVSPKNGVHLREVVPHCTIHIIPNAGHEITVGDTSHDPAVTKSLHDHILNFCAGDSRKHVEGNALGGGGGGGGGGGSAGSGANGQRDEHSSRASTPTPHRGLHDDVSDGDGDGFED